EEGYSRVGGADGSASGCHDTGRRVMDQGSEQDRRFAELMRAAQGGDSSAYVELLGLITPLLRPAVRRRRGFLQLPDIEDIVQDILLSLHTVRATYDPARPFWPWLMAIARNRMVDSARRHGRRSANEVAAEPLPETFSYDSANIYADTYGDP